MPHLHLPASHQVEDLILAHRVAEAVDSADLYVAWSHDAGAGQRPEVRAHVRPEPSPLVEAVATLLNWLGSALSAMGTSSARPGRATGPQDPKGAQESRGRSQAA